MKLLLLSAKLFLFGYFCDLCSNICTKMTEKRITKEKPLTGRLLNFISNLSANSLVRWQIIERRVISLSLLRQPYDSP